MNRYWGLMLLALMTGCAGAVKPAADDPPLGSQFTVPESDAAARAPGAKRLWSGCRREAAVVLTAGGEGERALHLQPGDGGTCVLSIDKVRRAVLRWDDSGDLLLLSDEDHDTNVVVQYDPPVLMLPRSFAEHDGDVEQTATMTVTNASDGSPRDRGTCRYTLKVLGPQVMQTPAGAREVWIVRHQRKLDLGLARGTVTVWSAYQPGVGLVADRLEQRVKAFGLVSMDKDRGWRVAKHGDR